MVFQRDEQVEIFWAGPSGYGHFYPGKICNIYRKDYDIEFEGYGNEWRLNVPHKYVRRPRKKASQEINTGENVMEPAADLSECKENAAPIESQIQEHSSDSRRKRHTPPPKKNFLRAAKERIAVIENFSDEDEPMETCSEDDLPLSKLGVFADEESSENELECENETASTSITFPREWRWRRKSNKFPKYQFLYEKPEITQEEQPYAYFRKYFTSSWKVFARLLT